MVMAAAEVNPAVTGTDIKSITKPRKDLKNGQVSGQTYGYVSYSILLQIIYNLWGIKVDSI